MMDQPYIEDKAIALTERLIKLNVTPDKSADLAFAYVWRAFGITPPWETEDYDRKPIDRELDQLPDDLWNSCVSAETGEEITRLLLKHPQIRGSDAGRFACRIMELVHRRKQ
jgi:hypothetical protein